MARLWTATPGGLLAGLPWPLEALGEPDARGRVVVVEDRRGYASEYAVVSRHGLAVVLEWAAGGADSDVVRIRTEHRSVRSSLPPRGAVDNGSWDLLAKGLTAYGRRHEDVLLAASGDAAAEITWAGPRSLGGGVAWLVRLDGAVSLWRVGEEPPAAWWGDLVRVARLLLESNGTTAIEAIAVLRGRSSAPPR